MRLSDLQTGDKAVVVKVLGYGAFRKRIIEMGFVRGQTVLVELNAPLKDPIKYKIMDYEISLRRRGFISRSYYSRRSESTRKSTGRKKQTKCRKLENRGRRLYRKSAYPK